MAASNGWKDVVEYLIGNGAKIDKRDNFGKTALHMAASNGWKDVVEYLVVKGAKIHARNFN